MKPLPLLKSLSVGGTKFLQKRKRDFQEPYAADLSERLHVMAALNKFNYNAFKRYLAAWKLHGKSQKVVKMTEAFMRRKEDAKFEDAFAKLG